MMTVLGIFEPVEHGSIFEGKMKKNSAGFS
jgi:hypothetical protein